MGPQSTQSATLKRSVIKKNLEAQEENFALKWQR